MLAMSMAVVIALIGASGLGLVVWTGLGRNDVGYAAIGGIGIVAIAIILDRLSQSFSKSPTEKKQPGLLGRSINWLRSRLNKNRRN
jgi:glycine betaine/proline transport system permease protein